MGSGSQNGRGIFFTEEKCKSVLTNILPGFFETLHVLILSNTFKPCPITISPSLPC